MLLIEQRQLILRKNLVGCDDIIFFEHYVLKLMGWDCMEQYQTLGGIYSSFSFFWEQYKRAKNNNKKEKHLDKQGKNLLQ